jgi:hypothetical protein
MQILYTNGYSHKQLLDFRLSIWGYLLETSRRIAQDLRDLHLEPATQTNKVRSLTPLFAPRDFIPSQTHFELILNHPTDIKNPGFIFQTGFADAVQELWAEDGIHVLFDRPTYFSLVDNAA